MSGAHLRRKLLAGTISGTDTAFDLIAEVAAIPGVKVVACARHRLARQHRRCRRPARGTDPYRGSRDGRAVRVAHERPVPALDQRWPAGRVVPRRDTRMAREQRRRHDGLGVPRWGSGWALQSRRERSGCLGDEDLPVTPHAFIMKWRASTVKERSASQKHFIDLCRLLGEPPPVEADPSGEAYCFERGARKLTAAALGTS